MATSERKSVEYSVPATDQQNTKQQSQAIVVCLRLQAQTHKTTPINKWGTNGTSEVSTI